MSKTYTFSTGCRKMTGLFRRKSPVIFQKGVGFFVLSVWESTRKAETRFFGQGVLIPSGLFRRSGSLLEEEVFGAAVIVAGAARHVRPCVFSRRPRRTMADHARARRQAETLREVREGRAPEALFGKRGRFVPRVPAGFRAMRKHEGRARQRGNAWNACAWKGQRLREAGRPVSSSLRARLPEGKRRRAFAVKGPKGAGGAWRRVGRGDGGDVEAGLSRRMDAKGAARIASGPLDIPRLRPSCVGWPHHAEGARKRAAADGLSFVWPARGAAANLPRQGPGVQIRRRVWGAGRGRRGGGKVSFRRRRPERGLSRALPWPCPTAGRCSGCIF